MRPIGSLLAIALLASGCSEAYVIRSYPNDVRMSVNEEYVGITPVVVPLTRAQMRPYRWRAEKEGYEIQEGTMQPRVAPGRIWGYIFTVGILAIFKGPQYMPDLVVDMKPLPKSEAAAPAAVPATHEDRLRHAENLHRQGMISDQEYQTLRREILRDLGEGAQ